MPPHAVPPLPAAPDSGALERELARALRAVGDGGLDAFAHLYDLTAARVFGLARQVLHETAAAEQVTREVFVQVWRDAGGHDPSRGTVLAWLTAITHRRAVERLRRSGTGYGGATSEPGHSRVDSRVHSPDAERVRAALAALEPALRDAVQLAYHGGQTHTEVERLTGAPAGVAASRIRDGLTRLGALLAVPAPDPA